MTLRNMLDEVGWLLKGYSAIFLSSLRMNLLSSASRTAVRFMVFFPLK
jgi:hypothetical protein